MAVTNVPIWRDEYVGLGSVSSRSYVVKLGGGTIYAGTAYARPGESVPYVLINDIAAPYLSQNDTCLDVENGNFYSAADIIKTFKIYDANNVQYGNDLACYLNCEDDGRTVNGSNGAHAPINSRVMDGMPIILTAYNSSVLDHDGGGTTKVRVRYSTEATASPVLNWNAAGNYTVLADFTGHPGAKWVKINGFQYDLVESCAARYALYYVNAYGAWDFLVIEGAAQEGRRYTRHELARVHNNADVQSREIWNYANESRRTWVLHTGWIDETGAERMHHLIGSTLVYLYDADGQIFRPVVVTDTEVTVRRYEQEGKPVSYAITVEEGREGLRR